VSDTSKIVLTFKQGTGYDAPWVVIHGDSVAEASLLLEQVRTTGVFAGVRGAAAEFASPVSETEAVATVTNAFPGSTVVTPPVMATGPPAQSASMDPRCPDCGGAMQFKSGTGATGSPYRGWFCDNKPRGGKGHVIWL
jgi:hypothetical protein